MPGASVSPESARTIKEVEKKLGPLAQLHEMAVAPLRAMADSEQVQRVFRIAMHQTEYTAELAPVQERYLEGSGEFQQQLADALLRAQGLGWLRPSLR